MNILSKNSPLEESIAAMEAVLEKLSLEVVYSTEKHPLSHCYSVNLASKYAPNTIYSNGKGALSLSSKASALGEYIERLQTNHFFSDFYVPELPFYPDEVVFEVGGEYLTPELLAFYNPNDEWSEEDLIDFNSDNDEKIVALPFIDMGSGEKVYFPHNILANLYASNGLATGNTPKEAQVQAMSEICERYVKIEVIKRGYALPEYPETVLKNFPKVLEDIRALQEAGYILKVLDASFGGKFPVCAISLINPKTHTLFVSFGSHPILEVALERTMTELMQGRDLSRLDDFEIPTFDRSIVEESLNIESHFIDSNGKMGFDFLSSKKTFVYASWGYSGNNTDDEFEYLMALFNDMDKRVYLREYAYLGVYSCQMIVPGVSEIYPVEDMVYNNKNTGKRYREMILHFDEFDPEEILDEVYSLSDALNVEKFIGVLFEENFTMGQLKAQLHLLLGNYEEASAILTYEQGSMSNLLVELMAMERQGLSVELYMEAFCDLYTAERFQKAQEILEGSAYLINRTLSREYTYMLSMAHQLHEVKERYYGS